MAKIITVDAQVAKKMMDIVEYCSYCSVLDENNDVHVTGFDEKCDNIMARMWDCYNALDEAEVEDDDWHVDLYDCNEQDFNDLLFHAFFNIDDDEAFRKVMFHTFFTTECFNSVLDTLVDLTQTAVWYREDEDAREVLDRAIGMMVSEGSNQLKRYVHEVIENADCRFEREYPFDDMIDNILGECY